MTISSKLELELTGAVGRDGMLELEAEPNDKNRLNQTVASSGMNLETISQLTVCHRQVCRMIRDARTITEWRLMGPHLWRICPHMDGQQECVRLAQIPSISGYVGCTGNAQSFDKKTNVCTRYS